MPSGPLVNVPLPEPLVPTARVRAIWNVARIVRAWSIESAQVVGGSAPPGVHSVGASPLQPANMEPVSAEAVSSTRLVRGTPVEQSVRQLTPAGEISTTPEPAALACPGAAEVVTNCALLVAGRSWTCTLSAAGGSNDAVTVLFPEDGIVKVQDVTGEPTVQPVQPSRVSLGVLPDPTKATV
jgi:hypothetical protein